MNRLRNVMFGVLLLVAISTQGKVARASSMNLFDDFVDFYNCSEYWDGLTYTLYCTDNCEDNPHFYFDAADVCAWWCGGSQWIASNPTGECITGCSCILIN